MFDYDYINELKEFGTCLYKENYEDEEAVELVVRNNEVTLAIYEYTLEETFRGYSMICRFVGADEDKGLVWAVGLTSGIGSQKVFDSRKDTNRFYRSLRNKAPENFKLIYEGCKNVG